MYKTRQFIFTNSWKLSKIYEKSLRNIGCEKKLTQCEMDVLIFLNVNYPLNTSKEISEFRSISKSLICKSVASLVEKGYLISENDLIDARVLRLTLTELGKNVSNELVDSCEKLCQELSWGITESEISFVENIQERMLDNSKNIV